MTLRKYEITIKQDGRRKRNRLEGYDYSQGGYYFITICTENKRHFFGKIKNEKMEYSQYGDIVLKYWQAIPSHYKNVFLDEWIIMPNHIHGVIVIDNDFFASAVPVPAAVGAEHCSAPTAGRTTRTNIIRANIGVNQISTNTNKTKNTKYGLLSKIVKSFKEISVKTIRNNFNNYEFFWQRSYYDHIVRNGKSLNNIRQYIINNPAKWEHDRNNSENLYI